MNIAVEHITKTFGTFTALRDVGLTIGDGELVALLGPSGSGKTTLLRMIAGLEVPDARPETVIRFDGQAVDWSSPAQRRVGFVFQHYALFRTMSVFENVAFGLRVRPRKLRLPESAIRSKVHELLALIQLESLADRYPSQLSGGQRQRVALARALAIEPEILLLDEPFGALDAKVRQSLRRWLRRLHDEIHVTSLLVTHDQEEALEVADRVVIMKEGRIEQVGTPEEVFHRPQSAFVMDFLGNVNLFHARLEGPGGGPENGNAGRVKVRVRPHDLDVSREDRSGSALRASVRRIQTASALVKVEVLTEHDDVVVIEVPHDRFSELNLRVADTVFVSVKDARVFAEDYSI